MFVHYEQCSHPNPTATSLLHLPPPFPWTKSQIQGAQAREAVPEGGAGFITDLGFVYICMGFVESSPFP